MKLWEKEPTKSLKLTKTHGKIEVLMDSLLVGFLNGNFSQIHSSTLFDDFDDYPFRHQ